MKHNDIIEKIGEKRNNESYLCKINEFCLIYFNINET